MLGVLLVTSAAISSIDLPPAIIASTIIFVACFLVIPPDAIASSNALIPFPANVLPVFASILAIAVSNEFPKRLPTSSLYRSKGIQHK